MSYIITIIGQPHPWKKWDVDLYKEIVKDGRYTVGLEHGMLETPDSDWIIMEWYSKSVQLSDKGNILLFANVNEYTELQELIKEVDGKNNVYILAPTKKIYDHLKLYGISTFRWLPPVKSEVYRFEGPKKGYDGLSIVCNAARTVDNLAEIVRTYFATCLIEEPEYEGELKCLQKLDIFSHVDLPFEVFNDITFHGLQSTPKMLQLVSNSRAFISPYSGIGVPLINFDVEKMGVPMILRDTETNRELFPHANFFNNEEELAKAIKFYAENNTIIQGLKVRRNPWEQLLEIMKEIKNVS